MGSEWTDDEKREVIEQVWQTYNVTTLKAVVRCKNDGYQIPAAILACEQPHPEIRLDCPRCGVTYIDPELDPKRPLFRNWTDDEKQELFDRQMQGLSVVCPVDGTRLSIKASHTSASFHCHRCGRSHFGYADRRIGTKPLEQPVLRDGDVLTADLLTRYIQSAINSSRTAVAPMDKRYQVFVSSTFTDLIKAREEATRALLGLKFLPVEMEVFPASPETQWTLIRRLIDDCDYYIVIIAARYGSVSKETGLSYTEMEYDYAIDKGIPVAGFIHSDPGSVHKDFTDKNAKLEKKLETFKNKVRQRMVASWSNPDELAYKVSQTMHHLMRDHPAEGWVKAKFAGNADEIQRLQARIAELEAQINAKPNLSPEAVVLLKAACEDENGLIMTSETLDGSFIGAGKLKLEEEEIGGRKMDSYEEAVEELLFAGFIRRKSADLYTVTKEGIEAWKKLK